MRCRLGYEFRAWLLMAAGCAPLVACGGRAKDNHDTPGGSAGAGTSVGGGGAVLPGGGGADAGVGGDDDGPPEPVDPEISRAWIWEPCGTLEPEAADREALFDAAGQIVVLGPGGVRVHDANGVLESAELAPDAQSLLTAPDGSVLSVRTAAAGITLTPLLDSDPRWVLPIPPVTNCGAHLAFSGDGDYVFTTDGGMTCAWRVADSTFAGSVASNQTFGLPTHPVAIHDSKFVRIDSTDSDAVLVRYDFMGQESSRLVLGTRGVAVLSPTGDRAVIGSDLVDLETGKLTSLDATASNYPLFSARGEVVLLGDGVFSAKDGARLFSLAPGGRLASAWSTHLVLSADGSRAISSAETAGRATLLDVAATGVRAVLGPLPLPDGGDKRTSDLAISADGSLLVQNVVGFAAFGIQVASSFEESQLLWGAAVSVNLAVDVSRDGRFAAVGGDGRALYAGSDGTPVWPSPPPPPNVSVEDVCLLDRLRISPKANWIAGSGYSGELELFKLDANRMAAWPLSAALPSHCDAPAFSRNEQLLATSAAALYRREPGQDSWHEVWSTPFPEIHDGFATRDVDFSPDETQLLVSRCEMNYHCTITLLDAATGKLRRAVPELNAPHPSFSPEGSWIAAGNKLLHLPSGEIRSLSADADGSSPALFTPDGDIIASSPNGALTRYCRKD